MLTLLVADHEPSFRKLLRVVLTRACPCEVIEAADGAEALARAREVCPSLVIIDLAMPALSGLGVCRALKADPVTRHIPVWILSDSAAHDTVAKAATAGADGYFHKPPSFATLEARVRALGARASALQGV
jgi:two-component system cell cycle response regulator